MIQHRFTNFYIGVIFFILCPLFTGVVKADNSNTAWSQFKKAAVLYQQKGEARQIIELLETVQRNSQDLVLSGRAAFLISATYERENQLENALFALKKLYSNNQPFPQPVVSEAWLRTGHLYLKQSKLKFAESAFQNVIEGEGSQLLKQEAILALAWIAAQQNRWYTCDSLLSLFVLKDSIFSEDERSIILQARGAIAAQQPEIAIQLLQNTQSRLGLQVLASAYELAGKQIMAVSVYKKLHDLYPNTPGAQRALFQAAEVFMRAEDWLAANSELKRLLPKVTDDALADAIHFRQGWIHINLKNYDQALIEFRSSVVPKNASYFKYMEAECLHRKGKEDLKILDQAILLFHNIASIDLQSPLAPLAKLKAALIEMEKGDSTSALVSLRQFLSLYPQDELTPAVYFLLGVNERQPVSQRYLDQIVQQNVDSDVFDVAYFAMQNQDFRKENYQKVITRNASLPQKTDVGRLSYWQRCNHLLLGESAYFLKHYDQALVEYHLARDNETDDLSEKADIGTSWCVLQIEGPDSALASFEEIRERTRGINKILADYGYATVQFIRQEYQNALKAYPIALSTDQYPQLEAVVVKSLYRSAQCYYRLEYYMQAIETWDKLAREYPEHKLAVESLYNIADVYFRANYFNAADSVYQIIMNKYQDDPLTAESTLKLAQSAYNAGNYELAVTRYQTFIDQYPNHQKNKDALEGIQLSYYQIGQIDQASETLKKVIDQTSNTDLAIDAHYRLAMNYFQEQKYQEAIEAFKEILTLYPNSSYAVDAQFSLCKCYTAQGDYQSANQELLRFVQYFPTSVQLPEAYFLLGVGYYQMESYLSAIDYFTKVIQEYSDSDYFGSALKNSAWCYDRLKEKDSALQSFQTYLAQYPAAEDALQIQLQVARLLNETGKTIQAITHFQELQKISDPLVSIEASYRLGMMYISQEQSKKAQKAFQAAVSMNGGDNYYRLSAMAQLAAIYENQGDTNKAISTYESLVNSTTQDSWITAARERINVLQLQVNSTSE